MLKSVSLLFFTTLILACAGCAQHTPPQPKGQMGNLLVAEPAPVNPRAEMLIARYNQVLAIKELGAEEKAELFYQRGVLYDSVGLRSLARFDYQQALQLKADMAPAYNSMGIHHVLQKDFIQAYEAFDASLDIDPDYDFAFLNRGIALYYGGRANLAIQDLMAFADLDRQDPFRLLWAYFAYLDAEPTTAQAFLLERRGEINENHWAVALIDLFIGNATESVVLGRLIDGVGSQKELTDRLCEAYFYLGKYHQMRNERGVASNYFKLALSTNVYDYVEHRYARFELNRIRNSNKN